MPHRTSCSLLRGYPKPVRERSCAGSCARLPPTISRISATPQPWPIRRWSISWSMPRNRWEARKKAEQLWSRAACRAVLALSNRCRTIEQRAGGMPRHSACFFFNQGIEVVFFLCNILFHGIIKNFATSPPESIHFVAQSRQHQADDFGAKLTQPMQRVIPQQSTLSRRNDR